MRATLALKDKKKASRQQGKVWVEPLREWILDIKQANFLSSSDNFSEIASFVKKVGTNPLVRDKTARFSVPSPFGFVLQGKARLPLASSRAATPRSLSRDEVSFCEPSGV